MDVLGMPEYPYILRAPPTSNPQGFRPQDDVLSSREALGAGRRKDRIGDRGDGDKDVRLRSLLSFLEQLFKHKIVQMPTLRGNELYLLGTTLDLQFQAEGSNTFGLLAVTVIKRFEPFTSAAVLLVQRHSDNEKAILKLADRRLGHRSGKGGPVPWSPSLENHLQHAVRDIQEGVAPNWFKLIRDYENRPDVELWEDWMWEVSTWRYMASNHNTELAAYRLLRRLQGRYIPRLFGVVRLRITPESTTLHPITDVVQGLIFDKKQRISSQVMEAFRAIEAENCVLHNDIHIGNVVLRDGNHSPVIIDFGQAGIRDPELSDEEWSDAVRGGPDTRYMRRLLVNPEDGPWKRTVTPYEMSNPHYKNPLVFNKYVESMPEDFRRMTFERVLDTDWEGAREKMYRWRIRPGIRCRPIYD
ncbi:hypothetical protein ARMSODRAFT_1017059 [Armillaria solidipes]|uniref:Aminoglycoside phosphotransferase domain-containing protein n=1 Tax=Armillaria solidipes TaxID=1076256 RepID=A0A2H3C4T7_9AGAR|nr:hypothetical protein ARMSODRAFT_1017059 [Armillaria solidipes]